MSAFIVEDSLINGILTFWSSDRYGGNITLDEKQYNSKTSKDLQELGQILLDENYKSFNFRYNDTGGDAPKFIFNLRYQFDTCARIQAINVLKACNCFDYQACETDEYNQSKAFKIINHIRSNAISRLPEYDKAEGWGEL
jgi:hypothetical protein